MIKEFGVSMLISTHVICCITNPDNPCFKLQYWWFEHAFNFKSTRDACADVNSYGVSYDQSYIPGPKLYIWCVMTLTTFEPEASRNLSYHSFSKNPPGATSKGFGWKFLYTLSSIAFRLMISLLYCSALTRAPIPLPLNSLPEEEKQQPTEDRSKGNSNINDWKRVHNELQNKNRLSQNTKFPRIYLVSSGNGKVHKSMGIARIPVSFPLSVANFVSTI